MSAPAQAEPNCPFYGRYTTFTLVGGGVIPPQRLRFVETGGNQCALVLDSAHPCEREAEHKPVDWRRCPVLLHATIMRRWRP